MNTESIYQVATLFSLLSNDNNLKIDFNKEMPESAIEAVPQTLRNFGLNSKVEVESDFSNFLIELADNSYEEIPTILQFSTQNGKSTSILVDGMYEVNQKVNLLYSDGSVRERNLYKYFFHMKFGEFGNSQYVYWGVFDPVHVLQNTPPKSTYNPTPTYNKYIKNFKLIKTSTY